MKTKRVEKQNTVSVKDLPDGAVFVGKWESGCRGPFIKLSGSTEKACPVAALDDGATIELSPGLTVIPVEHIFEWQEP